MRSRLVTKSAMNVRKGPGMVFETVKQIPENTELFADEFRKAADGVGWYKISGLGWVCAEYVTLAQDVVADKNLPKKGKIDLQQFSSISLGGGTTVDVGSVAGSISHGRQSLETAAESVLRGVFGSSGFDTPGPDYFLKQRIFGAPYQFRKSEDIRNPSGCDHELGLSFLESVSESAFISVIPGAPLFLPDLDDQAKENYFLSFESMLKGIDKESDMVGNKISSVITEGVLKNDPNVDIKYFTFRQDYTHFMQYMNTLCWMFAGFLLLSGDHVPGTYDSTYGDFNWARWHMSNAFGCRPADVQGVDAGGGVGATRDDIAKTGADISKSAEEAWANIGAVFDGTQSIADATTGIVDAGKTIMENFDMTDYYTSFFINPNISYSETFSNQTKESMLAGVLSGASDMAKEISFLLASGMPESNMAESQAKLAENVNKAAGMFGGGNSSVIGRVLHSASTVISGANIVFPQMWASSEYSRSFNVEISLKSPYGTKEAIFKDIIVPMCFWIALATPKQNTVNTYSAPFLCRFFVPGFCASDLAIVESLNITKGGDGTAWTIDGLPLEVNLQISLKDLYTAMMLSMVNDCSPLDAYNFLWNNSLIDYITVGSGLDIRKSEWATKLGIAAALASNSFEGIVTKNADLIRESLSRSRIRFGGLSSN